jgi:tellurite resistance protein TerC
MSHTLASSFAGASIQFWLLFHAIVAVLLFVDLVVLGRSQNNSAKATVRKAWAWTAVLAAAAFCFAVYVSHRQGHDRAVEFISGYLVEGSLSIDNLFVFLLLFRSLGLKQEAQRQVLLWGVLGAIGLRAICIFAGVALLDRFAWVQDIFGVVLLIAGIRLLRTKHEENATQPAPIRWIRGRIGSEGGLTGPTFLLVVLAVEATDLLFALDSIPAVLAITRDTFIVYTSNIFAILGLRSLYFGLAGLLDKLRLLHYGLAVILMFVAAKMLTSNWIAVPAWVSLLVILGILAVAAAASWLVPAPKATA